MALAHGRAEPAHPGKHYVPTPVHKPSPTVVRQAVVAVRNTVTSPVPHASVYTPWNALLAKAEARLKVEIQAAITELERDSAVAGTLLDTAYATAAEAAGHLEDAAWAAWHKYMAAADDTRNGILGPATSAYDATMASLHSRYEAALADADKTYKSLLADAQAAEAVVKTIPA